MIPELANKDFNALKDGLSGIMRVHNEERLIEACIDSCINALDELVVVCNDCTDGTLDILNRKVLQYPEKLRVFEYNRGVLSFNLSEQEFQTALNLPEDSERLYCNLCNYGIAQVRFKYATKIDTDQTYFEDEMSEWAKVCKSGRNDNWSPSMLPGMVFSMYFSVYRRLSAVINKPVLPMIPHWLVKMTMGSYRKYTKWCLSHDKASVALSGLNVFKDKDWFVPFDMINIHPPYNGEGDTVIFKVSRETFFTRTSSERVTKSVTEKFNQPHKMMFSGPVWFHQHANRVQYWEKVKKVKDQHPDWFVPIEAFPSLTYKEILAKQDEHVTTLFQRTLFALIHMMGTETIKNHFHILDKSGL